MKIVPLLTAAASVVLCSCAAQPRLAIFNEAEYAPFRKGGTGKITGQAFMRTKGGDVKYAAGQQVNLNPVTTYSKEWFERAVLGGQTLAPADPRLGAEEKHTLADAEGRFEFNGLAAGDYYLTSWLTWIVPTEYVTITTGGTLAGKYSVANGQTTKVVLTR